MPMIDQIIAEIPAWTGRSIEAAPVPGGLTKPKPLAWRMRARVGDRRQWWTDVDEVR